MTDHLANAGNPMPTLELAELLEQNALMPLDDVAAAELRRLHAENETLRYEVDAIAAIKEERDAMQSENAELWADAERYWWLAKHGRSTSEHWGGRWSIVIDGPCPKSHNSEDDFDAAIDAARSKT